MGGWSWQLPSLPGPDAPAGEAGVAIKTRGSVLDEIAKVSERWAKPRSAAAARVTATGPAGRVACEDLLAVLKALRAGGLARIACAGVAAPVAPAPPAVREPLDPARAKAGASSPLPWDSVMRVLSGWAEPDGVGVDERTGFPRRIRRAKDGMRMLLVPAGTFVMGDSPKDPYASLDPSPRHRVRLTKAYYMDEHEVTNAQFERFAAATRADLDYDPRDFVLVTNESMDGPVLRGGPGLPTWQAPLPGSRRPRDWPWHPVVLVRWTDARAYAAWAGPPPPADGLPAGGVTLPTEAQFERALRGGVDDAWFPWGDALPPPSGAGNYCDETANRVFGLAAQRRWWGPLVGYDDGFDRTAPVMSFRPNAYGLYDLGGNVWEWCLDDENGPADSASGATKGAGAPETRRSFVVRGSSWAMSWDSNGPTCSIRAPLGVGGPCDHVGFRCVYTLP